MNDLSDAAARLVRKNSLGGLIDIDAYLRRVGYAGRREPTLATLRALHLLHPQTIAFENLNPLLGWPVGIDPSWIEQKLVNVGRGGWCFEQNLLFASALKTLGFQVSGLGARVLWGEPEDAITRRTHMLLRVDIDGEIYLSDVGFGGLTLTGPLKLELDVEQQTPHEPFRLIQAGSNYKTQARIGDAWRTLYRFDLQEQFLSDYEVSSYFLSTHPNSHFLKGLLAARPAPGRRYALFNSRLAIHHVGGATERHVLSNAAEIRATLEKDFLIAVPDSAELDAVLQKLIVKS